MNNKNNLAKVLLALAAIYIISPVDLAAGPMDDFLVVLLTWGLNNINLRRDNRNNLPPEK